MSLQVKRQASRAASGVLIALLMSSTATAALAAPKARPSQSSTEARLTAMQQQLDEMRAQMAQMAQAKSAGGDERVAALQQQLDAANQQIADLTAVTTAATSDIATLKAPPVVVALSNGKPSFTSQDKRFSANIRAIIMMDAGKYFQKNNLPASVAARDLNEGVNFRRARIGFDGKVFKDFDYSIVYDFGGSGVEEAGRLYEASMTYTALKPFRIKVGAYEPNIGLAAATSTSAMPLMERPAPAEVARNVAAGDSRTAVQVMANGVMGDGDTGLGARWLVSTAFTGNTLGGTQPFDEQTAWVARAVVAPFSSVDWQGHLGFNYQYVIQPNDALGPVAGARYPIQLRDRPEARLDGARLVDTGAIDSDHARVMGVEAAFQVRNFLIESEAFRYKIERRITALPALPDPKFDGWYVQGSWVLTGEPRLYDPLEGRFAAPRQNYNFNPSANTWGAFEIAARYSVLDLNYNEGNRGVAGPFGVVRGGEQKIITVGGNWYFNPALRFMLNWQQVEIDRLNAAGAQIGQKFNTVMARGQFTF